MCLFTQAVEGILDSEDMGHYSLGVLLHPNTNGPKDYWGY